jgi:micrococcal nuclease
MSEIIFLFKKYKIKTIIIACIILTTGSATYVTSTPKYKTNRKNIPAIEVNKEYEVVKVIDGDTFDIKIGSQIIKVRMLGIDTPETVDPRKDVQCFGKQASDKTKELLLNKLVTLETDPTQSTTDKYNRILAYVYSNSVLINKYLIENGYAHEYTYNIPYSKQIDFKSSEKSARENRLGLWGSICLQK